MKSLKKILLVLVFTFVLFGSLFTVVSADTVTNDDGKYNYTTENENIREIAGGVEAIVNTGYTTRGKTNYAQRVSLFSADFSKNSDIKIATWASLNASKTGYIRHGLLDIAKDYEANNPGWVVLAGVNADQYYQKVGTGLGTDGSFLMQPQPYYPMLSNGDNLFVATPYGYSSNMIGFKNDGSIKPFVRIKSENKGLYIHVYNDNNEEVGLFPLDGLNCDLGTKKAVLIANYKKDANSYETITRTTENGLYIVENADLSYVSCTTAWQTWDKYAVEGFFGKGKISKIDNTVTYDKEVNSFAIETTNEELKALLNIGTYIKVQIELDDSLAGIEEGMGWHTIQRLNGEDCNVDNSYNTRAYPRSMFGCDENGKVYLMTCFGDNSAPTTGLYAQEFNALCKKYGIVEAYQMDGGGSVTCVARDENGILNYAEACVEASHGKELTYSSYRSILSGLFIVMKVPEAKIEVGEVSQNEVKLNVDTSKIKGVYDKGVIRITEPGTTLKKDYQLDLSKDDNLVSVTELNTNKTYNYELFVQKNGYEEQKTFINGSFNTYKNAPTILSVQAKVVEGGVKVTITYKDDDKALVKMLGKFGTRELNFNFYNGTAETVIKDTYNVLDMQIIGDCVLDATSSKHQTVEIKLNNVNYPVTLYFDYTIDSISSIIKDMMR